MVYLKSGFNPLAPTLGGKDEGELRDTLRLPAASCCTCPVIPAEAGIHKSLRRLCHAFPINPEPPLLGDRRNAEGLRPSARPVGGACEANLARDAQIEPKPRSD